MEDRGWKMEDGRWRIEDGGWKMEDRGWRMEDGRWRMEGGPLWFSLSRFDPLSSVMIASWQMAWKYRRPIRV
jgi:hypothetical protein